MTLLWFDIIATLIYAASMVCLLHEFRALTPEARHERQTVPMLLAVTALYVVVGRMRHINGQLPEKYGGSSTAVYENADGALLKALVNGFLPGMILYSFPRNTTAPFSLTSVSMTLTIRCWAKASFSTM